MQKKQRQQNGKMMGGTPLRYKENSGRMAAEVMILEVIAMIAQRPVIDGNYCRGNKSILPG